MGYWREYQCASKLTNARKMVTTERMCKGVHGKDVELQIWKWKQSSEADVVEADR